MNKLETIQADLATARLERARLRQGLREIEDRISDLEASQDVVEQAIAIVGGDAPERAARMGFEAVRRVVERG